MIHVWMLKHMWMYMNVSCGKALHCTCTVGVGHHLQEHQCYMYAYGTFINYDTSKRTRRWRNGHYLKKMFCFMNLILNNA